MPFLTELKYSLVSSVRNEIWVETDHCSAIQSCKDVTAVGIDILMRVALRKDAKDL